MQRLCALNLLFLILSFYSASVLAENSELGITTQYLLSKGSPSVDDFDNRKSSGYQQSFYLLSPRTRDGFRLSGSYSLYKRDYSDYLIQDTSGNEVPIDFDKSEASGSVGLEHARGKLTSNINHSTSIADSPFEFKYTELKQSLKLNHDLSILSWTFGSGKTSQPLSYFTDLQTAQRRVRPTEIQVSQYILGFDQVLQRRWKIYSQIEYSKKSDRPDAFGVTLRSAHAVTDKDFIKVELVRMQENRSQGLKYDRGYFDLSAVEVIYSRYLTYDLIAAISYGIAVEREDNTISKTKDQFATDHYALALDYQGRQWKAGFKLEQVVSNVNYGINSYGGQFQWYF